jgi:hypothetical protein
LVGALEHVLCSMSYMGCHPSHWLIFFRWIETTNQSWIMGKRNGIWILPTNKCWLVISIHRLLCDVGQDRGQCTPPKRRFTLQQTGITSMKKTQHLLLYRRNSNHLHMWDVSCHIWLVVSHVFFSPSYDDDLIILGVAQLCDWPISHYLGNPSIKSYLFL